MPPSSAMTLVPMMSAGIRSGVNWMRLNEQVEHVAERADQQRLAEAGHAFEQRVAAGQHAGQDAAHDLVLADDDLGDLILDGLGDADELSRWELERSSSHTRDPRRA